MHNKMKIKKGDTVKILSGKDKGKTGKILRVIPSINKVVVESINIHTRFERSKKAGQPGQRITFPSPLHSSNVMLLDSNSGKTTRIGYTKMEDGSKMRIGRKTGKAV